MSGQVLRDAIREAIRSAERGIDYLGNEEDAVVDAVVALVEAYLREHDRELLQAFLDNGVYGERWKVDGYNEGYALGYARALADAERAVEARLDSEASWVDPVLRSNLLAVVRRLAESDS